MEKNLGKQLEEGSGRFRKEGGSGDCDTCVVSTIVKFPIRPHTRLQFVYKYAIERQGVKTETGLMCKHCSKEFEGCEVECVKSLLKHITRAECEGFALTDRARKLFQCLYDKKPFDDALLAEMNITIPRRAPYALRSRTRIQKKKTGHSMKDSDSENPMNFPDSFFDVFRSVLSPAAPATRQEVAAVPKSKGCIKNLQQERDEIFRRFSAIAPRLPSVKAAILQRQPPQQLETAILHCPPPPPPPQLETAILHCPPPPPPPQLETAILNEYAVERQGVKTETGLMCKHCSKEFEGCEVECVKSLLKHITRAECEGFALTDRARKLFQCLYDKKPFDDALLAEMNIAIPRRAPYALRSRTRIQKKKTGHLMKDSHSENPVNFPDSFFDVFRSVLSPAAPATRQEVAAVPKSKGCIKNLQQERDEIFRRFSAIAPRLPSVKAAILQRQPPQQLETAILHCPPPPPPPQLETAILHCPPPPPPPQLETAILHCPPAPPPPIA
ncbi:hypothetical protein M5689_022386 [Euphorbia peplus]|nr:hypothetical protein M5689_022386 [Euphorbia peplus]